MANDIPELKRRIESLADADLVAMLACQQGYTPAALEIAQAEADRRGGLAHLEQDLSGRDPETHQSSTGASRLVPWVRRMGSWVVPATDRCGGCRVLRMTVSFLRIISALAGLTAGTAVVAAVLAGPLGSGPGTRAFPVALLVIGGLTTLVTCLSLQAVVLALVDTERRGTMAKRIGLGAVVGVLASLLSWIGNRFYWSESGTGHHVSILDPLTLGALCVSLYFVIRADVGRARESGWLPLLSSQAPVVAAAGLVFGGGVVAIGVDRLPLMSVHMGASGFVMANLITAACGTGVCAWVARSARRSD
jgi:hypothetical protein